MDPPGPGLDGGGGSATPPAAAVSATSSAAPDPFARHAPPTDEELDRLLKSGFATEVRVDRVLVPAVVVDGRGRPVHGLSQKDFRVNEDRVQQRIDYFYVDREESISIGFLLDVSGSMRLLDKIGEAREAIRYFLDGLGPGDQASVLTFADDEVRTLAPFGTDPDLVLARLEAVKAYGQTALHDAIAAAPAIIDRDNPGRKAIVLITDGLDNFSKLSLWEAMTSARRVDVPIYALGFASDPKTLEVDQFEAGTNAEVLRMIAAETGGAFFLIHDPDELKEAIRLVEEDLRSQYVLGYTPAETRCDGSFRRIEVSVGRSRYRVRSRKGYYGGPC